MEVEVKVAQALRSRKPPIIRWIIMFLWRMDLLVMNVLNHVMEFVLMHQPHKQRYLERVAGLLNPGGAAVFEEPELSSQFCYPCLSEFYYASELTLELGKMKG
ncbi:hypothetical protein HCH_03801 [Hahella chejuensis KCTC 2396]|uniref:Uncharacterized protein n=2 Tax=Hahella chejuensis TaxID=158327 RepID=Q2SFP1_HAHCH|nr:hypothetical protein HCH_03801 [Hahella chejuensis KCTC 2396]